MKTSVCSLPNTPAASACPGLLRIVPAHDGGICRVRLAGGVLSAAQAQAIAHAAATYGSGVIELTNRANLQIRGIQSGAESALIDTLLNAELGPSHAEADDVRNVMLSPTAGIDAMALLDTRPLAAGLLDRLQRDFAPPASVLCRRLSPKFALQLDGGESLTLLGHHHDIWLSALPEALSVPLHASPASGPLLALGVAGSPCVAPNDLPALAAFPASRTSDVCAALIRLFLNATQPDESRMRHWLLRMSRMALLSALQQQLTFPLITGTALLQWRRAPALPAARFGAVAQRVERAGPLANRRFHVGAQAPVARIDAPAMQRLAVLSQAVAHGALRITPWQGVILADVDHADIDRAISGLRACGLIDRAEDPLANIIACTGAPDCAKAHADTKRDAHKIAALLPRPLDLQLSGCDRGCAAGHRPAYTLLATGTDQYDLFAGDGCVDPDARFGQRIATGLTVDAAAAQLTLISSTDFPLTTHA